MASTAQGPDVTRWQRQLLPGELVAPDDPRRSGRDWLVDGALGLAALVIGVVVLIDSWSAREPTSRWADVVLGVASLISLGWRRTRPYAVGCGVMVASAISGLAAGASLVALLSAAIRLEPPQLARVGALAGLSLLIYAVLVPHDGSFDVQGTLAGGTLLAATIAFGLFVRARRVLVRTLRAQAAWERAEAQRRVQDARQAERQRIAREMHDVLAHRVSLLSVHAGALEFRPDASPAEVAEAAGVIRAGARDALEELRGIVGLLREERTDGLPEPPQPTLAALPRLVADARAAGTRVEASLACGEGSGAPAAVQRTVFRGVQEGLTNARKHAPASAVRVDVRDVPGPAVAFSVRTAAPVGGATVPEPLPGGGVGLIGLRERVVLAGGTLHHGRGPGGEHVLEAEVPWTTP